MEKIENRICPECGEVYRSKQVAKIMLGSIDVTLKCENGHEWLEHYSMQYLGYDYKGQLFDRFGELISEKEDSGKK